MTVNERLEVLRKSMKAHGVNALIVPSADPHMSEYLPARWKQRVYFSGFTGSAGTLVVTEKESGLWTDGRYFVQAAREIADSEVKLYKMAVKGVPTVDEFLASKLSDKEVLGIDGSITAVSLYESYLKAVSPKGVTIKSVPCIDECYAERPPMPESNMYVHDIKYTGLTAKEKINLLRENLKKEGADSMIVTALPSIIWLLNVRGEDVKGNPCVVSYCLITPDDAVFFLRDGNVSPEIRKHLDENGIRTMPYNAVFDYIKSYNKNETFLVDKASTNYDLYSAIENNKALKTVYSDDPVLMMKAVKSECELKNIDNAHIKDGCALVRFQIDLEERMARNEKVTELDIVDMVRNERMKEEGYVGESFSCIAAYGANAAMMHYGPTEANHAVLEKKGFLLVDNGGHFLDGSTDTTRTYALGELTDLEKEYYTLVLKCHVDLAKVWFMEGLSGGEIDIIARNNLWKKGLDYRCGTGHGVGYLGTIHEGPQSMRRGNKVPFRPGMTVTDEPGVYEENVMGIRTENGLVCVEKAETEYGRFLGFKPLTYVPYDLTPVIPSLLDNEEIAWIDSYHANVYNVLAPHLTEKEREWLKVKTRTLSEQVK